LCVHAYLYTFINDNSYTHAHMYIDITIHFVTASLPLLLPWWLFHFKFLCHTHSLCLDLSLPSSLSLSFLPSLLSSLSICLSCPLSHPLASSVVLFFLLSRSLSLSLAPSRFLLFSLALSLFIHSPSRSQRVVKRETMKSLIWALAFRLNRYSTAKK